MNSIEFDRNSCIRCRVCEEVCPNGIIRYDEAGMGFHDHRINLCFGCGQCMAVCPKEALKVNGLNYETDFFKLPEQTGLEEPFYKLVSSRRSVRNFSDKPVPDEIIEKILKIISFAPPAFPPIKVHITVINNREVIEKALPLMIGLFEKLYNAMENPFLNRIIRFEVGKRKYKLIKSHLMPILKNRLPDLKKGTVDPITRNAPSMILFHYDKNGEDVKNDCIIATAYCMLAAHSSGLGASVMDIVTQSVNKTLEARKLFNIPESNEVASAVILGYPKYKYRKGINRALKHVEWIR